MKKWALAKVGDYEGDGARVPKLIMYNTNLRPFISSGDWCLCQFSVKALGSIQSDPDIQVLPDIPMDVTLGSMNTSLRTQMQDAVIAKGLTLPATPQNANMRQFLQHLLDQIKPGLNVEDGDVVDLE